ncbi:MAG TPA: hypothetical protein VLZ07_10040 [Syntrophales bacterium]|nr:hypothetical protein [Syntrophales bacterium]
MARRLSFAIILALVFIASSFVWAASDQADGETKKSAPSGQVRTNEQVPVLQISPREIDLGAIGPDEGVRGSFVLKNVGSGTLNWHVEGAEGWSPLDEKKLSGSFKAGVENLQVHVSFLKNILGSKETAGKPLIQMSIEGGNQINAFRKNLSFGSYREMLKFASNGGTRTFFVRFEIASRDAEPKIDVDPVRIDFGTVKPGEFSTKRIKVTNRGQEILRWHVSVKDNGNGTSENGRYSSFLNGDIRGSGVYLPPAHLKEYLDMAGKWTDRNGLPSTASPGSALKYRFSGSVITVFFPKETDMEDVALYVDDKHVTEPGCQEGQRETTECVIAEGIPQGQHVLAIVNRSGSTIVEGVRVQSRDVKRLGPGMISIFPDSGDTTREIDYVNVMVNAKQAPGFYDESIVFNSNGGKAVVEISVEISAENKAARVVDVFRYAAGYDYLYTANLETEAKYIHRYKKQGIAYRLFAAGAPGTTPFYRWYNAEKNDHFYSYDVKGEGRSLQGYVYEGTIGNIATSRLTNTRELYRWYNSSTGRHFYTTDPNGEGIGKRGYRFDGIAGYVR